MRRGAFYLPCSGSIVGELLQLSSMSDSVAAHMQSWRKSNCERQLRYIYMGKTEQGSTVTTHYPLTQ